MPEGSFVVDFKELKFETPGHCVAWICDVLGLPDMEAFPRPGDARGWRFPHWAVFATQWGFDILSERQHCHLVSHPILGVVGSFSKTPGDQCSHANAMADLRLTMHTNIRNLANIMSTIQSQIDVLDIPSVMEFSSKEEFIKWLKDDSIIEGSGLCLLICLGKDEVEKFISAVRRLENKFKIHPRQQFTKILKMDTKKAESMLTVFKGLDRDDNGEIRDIFSTLLQYGMVDMLECELLKLEEEKQARRERKRQGRKEKVKEKTIHDIIWEKVNATQRQMTELTEGALDQIQATFQQMSKELMDKVSETIRDVPKDPSIEQMEREITTMKGDIVVTLKENRFLCEMLKELGVTREDLKERFERIMGEGLWIDDEEPSLPAEESA